MVQNELQENMTVMVQSDGASLVGKNGLLLDKFNVSRAMLFDVALFAGIGFLSGFLIRRFASILIAFVLFGIALLVAQEMGVVLVQVNMNQLFQLFGIEMSTPLSNELIVPLIVEWVRANVVVAIAAIIGFLLGLQAG